MPKIYVEAYGCTSNQADAEIVKGLLIESGHTIISSPEESDASVILTCIVKTPTERKIVKRLNQLKEKPLVIAGCMPKAMKQLSEATVPHASLVGPDDIDNIVLVVEATIKGERVEQVSGDHVSRTCLPRVRGNPLVHISPICSGCVGNCSYCIVKYARGRLYSFDSNEIVEDARAAIRGGCKEVWVTAEDVAAYNYNGVQLPQLIKQISDLDGDFKVRIGMMTPSSLKPILKDLIKAYESPKVYKFIHVPVQAGSDRILGLMRRMYTVDDFKEMIKELRSAFPLITVSTDVICGFPGETEEEFQETVNLVKGIKPDVLNISRFWKRPGTEAAGMDGQLHGRETKKRSRVMSEEWRGLAVDVGRRWVGWQGEILINEIGKHKGVVGRNYAYKPVVIPDRTKLGDKVVVRVIKSGVGYLVGKRVSSS